VNLARGESKIRALRKKGLWLFTVFSHNVHRSSNRITLTRTRYSTVTGGGVTVDVACQYFFETVASIQIYFEGAKFFPSQGGEGRSPRPEGSTAEMGFLGRGQRAPSQFPPARSVGSAVSSPSGVRGGTPGKFEIWCNLRPQNSLQKRLITYKLLQKG